MRVLVPALCLLGLAACAAFADVPDPPCVSTSLDVAQRLLLIPDENGADPQPQATFTVTVKNNDCVAIPMPYVEVLVGGIADGRTGLCGSAVTAKVGDLNGVVTFNISGGGCFWGEHACVIRANGVIVRDFSKVMSPDYAGWDAGGVAGRWSLSINPVDFAAFVMAYQGGNGPASCHDYNNNGVVDPADFGVFAQSYSGGTRDCSP